MSEAGHSLRELGNRMDPEARPKWLVGAGTPYDDTRRPATDDAQALPAALASHPPGDERYLRADCIDTAYETAYDLGMVNRFFPDDGASNPKPKGLVQSHRYVDPDDVDSRTSGAATGDSPDASGTDGLYSMRALVERHEHASSHTFLSYNTRLNLRKPKVTTDEPVVDVDTGIDIGSGNVDIDWPHVDVNPPDVENEDLGIENANERGKDLGRLLGEAGYDVVGLCEAFREALSNKIETQFEQGDRQNRPIKEASGPLGSGLVSLVAEGDRDRLPNVERSIYSTAGPVAKGWQQIGIELDVPGVENAGVELFITHLRAGDNPGDRDARRQQLFRLLLQIRGRQQKDIRPEWPKIVMGDLNFHSQEANEYDGGLINDYDHLLEMMAGEDMQDAWLTHGGPAGGTTTTPYNDYEPHPSGQGPCHCKDFDPSTFGGDRLDYVFVEKPKPVHTINIDIPRMWRVPFTAGCDWTRARIDDDHFNYGGDEWAGERLFSDHLGIGFELLASPAQQ